ncbi:retrovirus-related pol polyprotein from transposon TNT 1-94 [Tanacetum coccineum]
MIADHKLTTAMMLLARAITQKFSTPTNNSLRTSSNTRNQAVIQDCRVDIQTKNARYGGNGHYASDCPKLRVHDAKYFREQMFLAMKDEARSNLNDEENDFMLDNSFGDDTLEELTAVVIMMALIQPADENGVQKLNNDAKAISENLLFSTSNICSESNEVKTDSQIPEMPKERKLLKMFEKMALAINALRDRIDVTLLEDRKRRWMSDKQKNELLENEIEKISSDSKDIQANLLKRIKILENDFKRSQAQSIDFELKQQHQKEKIACDVSLKSRLSTLNDENVLLKNQADSVVKERENSKLEYQKLFNSIKATRTQHQKELDDLIEHVNLKTYAYADVRSQNQDLLMTISEIKNKIKTIEKGKNVNTKSDKSKTSGTLLYVTLLPKNIAVKAKKVSNTKVNADRSKPVTSHSIPKNEQSQKQSVESSNSIRRPQSKDTKLKNRFLKNTNAKSSSAYVRKVSNSRVKIALFTSPVAAKSRNLGATSVIAKSRFSIAKTSTVTNKVIQLVDWIVDSGCSKHLSGNLQLLRNFVKKFMGTVRFRNDHFATIIGYGDYGVDLLTGSRESNLYTISISNLAASSLVCLMSKATSTKSWLWHHKLSHLNFGTINQLTSKDLVDGLLKFKYDKAHLHSACEQVQWSLKAQILKIRTDNGTEFKNEKLRSFYAKLGTVHHTLIARTPQQNGVVERQNCTLVEAARTMLIFSKSPEFLWAEAIAIACFTQNRSIVHTWYNKTPYELF